MIIYENLFFLWVSLFFLRIFLNPSYLWESLLIYDHLWESIWFMIICENLLEYLFAFYSVYKNKQMYEYHHLKQIFYRQNMTMIFWWLCMFFLLWILFILCLTTFLLNKSVFEFKKLSRYIYSFFDIRFFTINIFHRIHFDFNPTNSSFIFPSNTSFILPISF